MTLWKWLKNLFKPKKPTPVPVPKPKPVEEPKTPPPPTQNTRVPGTEINYPEPRDTVDNGNGESPDQTYIYSNLTFDSHRVNEIMAACTKIHANRARYQAVADKVNSKMPWWFIGLFHYRESSLSFRGALHNGDEILGTGRLTYRVPKGRGPFNTWEESAVDALRIKNYQNYVDWDLRSILERMERWNGLGYRSKIGDRGIIEYSPFTTAGSNFHDETGKYVRDGVFDKFAKEKQLGVFTLLKGLEIFFNEKIPY